jgi:hypothetical protein
MAEEYPDLYIRSTLSDPGTVPRSTAGISSSPDVIPYGMIPASNPTKYFADNFNRDLGVNISLNTPNYLYLRGRNQFNGARNGLAYLYYAQSNLLLYPNIWREKILYTSNQQQTIPVSAAKKGDVFVTPEPFVWVASPPDPGQHFCLIGRVATDTHPNEIPAVGNIQDFAAWIAANGGLGWRNVTTVDAKVDWTLAQKYNQGSTGDQMEVTLIANNLPIGSEVWFSTGTNLPGGGPISVPVTTIDRPRQLIGTQAFIPAGWETTFRYSYRGFGKLPPAGFNLQLRINYATAEGSDLYKHASSVEELGYEDMLMYHQTSKKLMPIHEFYARSNKAFEDGPVRLIVVGADSGQTGNPA